MAAAAVEAAAVEAAAVEAAGAEAAVAAVAVAVCLGVLAAGARLRALSVDRYRCFVAGLHFDPANLFVNCRVMTVGTFPTRVSGPLYEKC
jgi:hypothetical protein